MQPKDEMSIKLDIATLMLEQEPKDFYVGISHDAVERLTEGHGVDLQRDAYVCAEALSADEARNVEAHFVNVEGTAGGTGGGDDATTQVYAYRMTPSTRQ